MTYASTILGDSPVGFWELSEASGSTATDQTGNSNGTYNSGPTFGQTGIPGGGGATSVKFTSSTNVTIPNVSANEIADVFSYELWLKLAATISATSALLGVPSSPAPSLQITTAGAFALVDNNIASIVTATADITDTTTFHHLVATKSGSTVHLYLDGVDVTGTVTNRTFVTETTGFIIGYHGDNAHSTTSCYMAMVAIYNSALTSTQVSNHYSAGSGASSSPTSGLLVFCGR